MIQLSLERNSKEIQFLQSTAHMITQKMCAELSRDERLKFQALLVLDKLSFSFVTSRCC